MDLQYVAALWGTTRDKISKMNWKRLAPTFKVEKYPNAAFGIEITGPNGYQGLGLGLGLAKVDLWFGWLKDRGV